MNSFEGSNCRHADCSHRDTAMSCCENVSRRPYMFYTLHDTFDQACHAVHIVYTERRSRATNHSLILVGLLRCRGATLGWRPSLVGWRPDELHQPLWPLESRDTQRDAEVRTIITMPSTVSLHLEVPERGEAQNQQDPELCRFSLLGKRRTGGGEGLFLERARSDSPKLTERGGSRWRT